MTLKSVSQYCMWVLVITRGYLNIMHRKQEGFVHEPISPLTSLAVLLCKHGLVLGEQDYGDEDALGGHASGVGGSKNAEA
jgi:hypothetical protein